MARIRGRGRFTRPAFGLTLQCSAHYVGGYLGGALGGRTWAVQRRSGISDQLALRDYRVSLGRERILDGGSGLFGEVGYVFGRELEYEDSTADRSFEDAVMLLGGVTY